MKRYFFRLAILLFSFSSFFAACDSNEPNAENSDQEKDIAFPFIEGKIEKQKTSITIDSLHQCSNFKLSENWDFSAYLPDSIVNLESMHKLYAVEGATFSDTTAGFNFFRLKAYNAANSVTTLVYANKLTGTGHKRGVLWFTDKDVSIIGKRFAGSSTTDTISFNVYMTKGWNMVIKEITSYTDSTHYSENFYTVTTYPEDMFWHYQYKNVVIPWIRSLKEK